MQRLGVFFEDRKVGLVTADESRFTFTYDSSWIDAQASFAISISLPLVAGAQTGPAAHSFFANLLPEGRIRALVARRLGISEDNDFALLAALGGECAGAMVVAAAAPKPAKYAWRPLDSDELARLSTGGAAFAEAVAGGGVRLSLAGAQDKLPVKLEGGRLYLPLGSSPSSHILKFANQDFKHMPTNEAFISALARACGLPAVATEIFTIGRTQHLLVTRYDRVVREDGTIMRLHQEDMCQALGLPPGRKYQEEGGPSFEQCFRTVADASVEPALDTRALLHWLVFNTVVGATSGGVGRGWASLRARDRAKPGGGDPGARPRDCRRAPHRPQRYSRSRAYPARPAQAQPAAVAAPARVSHSKAAGAGVECLCHHVATDTSSTRFSTELTGSAQGLELGVTTASRRRALFFSAWLRRAHGCGAEVLARAFELRRGRDGNNPRAPAGCHVRVIRAGVACSWLAACARRSRRPLRTRRSASPRPAG